jgi:hypothetical protein
MERIEEVQKDIKNINNILKATAEEIEKGFEELKNLQGIEAEYVRRRIKKHIEALQIIALDLKVGLDLLKEGEND